MALYLECNVIRAVIIWESPHSMYVCNYSTKTGSGRGLGGDKKASLAYC